MSGPGPELDEFTEIINAPAPFLDRAALLISSHLAGPIDIPAQLARLDQLAQTVNETTLDGLRRTLFGPGGFAGNTVDYYDADNSYLHRVLDRRLGIPITLCLLAHEVGCRVGVPTAMVGMPGHFLLGDKVTDDLFIDPFNAGRLIDAAGAEQLFTSMGGSGWSPDYLAPTPAVQVVRRMLGNLHRVVTERRDFIGEYRVLQLAVCLPGSGTDARERIDQLAARFN